MSELFRHGSAWVRLDTHLHTRADKEFKFDGEDDTFVNSYVEKLVEQNIKVGIITNHNKFDEGEYKALRKKAAKQEIFLLPGIELSVNDGANGIHTLVVFNPDEWIVNGANYINQFITESFVGKQNNENENGRSNHDLITTIERLNKYHKSYFIILAHVEEKSGFFKALDGGRVQEFGKNKLFRNSVIAFQKVRTRDEVTKWEGWLDNQLPVFVEGSDPKKLDEIGKGKQTFIKIGDFNFEAVKFALKDKANRVKNDVTNTKDLEPTNSYIKSVSFTGGKLNETTIDLSTSMNNLVGVRGSGKSSIIEAIRYVLDLSFGKNSADKQYKEELVKALLGSGGKVTVIAVDNRGNEYTIERAYGHSIKIKVGDELKNLDIQSIINKPLYFGQKDLSSYKDGFESDLIHKLIGDKTKSVKSEIEIKQQEVRALLESIKKYASLDDKKEEVARKIEELKLKIDEFKKHNIEEKLQRQIEFNKDKASLQAVKKKLTSFSEELNQFVGIYERDDFFEKLKGYESKENGEIFQKLYAVVDDTKTSFLTVTSEAHKVLNSFKTIAAIEAEFDAKAKSLQEEFLEIQRKIDIPNLRADDFIKYNRELETQKLMMAEIDKSSETAKELKKKLAQLLYELNELYLKEFRIIEKEISSINGTQTFIELKAEFKGNKREYEGFLKNILGGSGLGKPDYDKLLEDYIDPAEIYNNFESIVFGGNKTLTFREKFTLSLSDALTFQVPNKIEIFYNGKELTKHSLGQRASALIIFILTQRENDIIIIDQPEDDLDNQTIYNEVIKELIKLKDKTQFIFATHNANIPVLGDCEQVIVCDYMENKILVEHGSIDNHDIQQKIIDIMEGGDEAFEKRGEIYNLWKH